MPRLGKRDFVALYRTFLRIIKDAEDYWDEKVKGRSWKQLTIDYNMGIQNRATMYMYREACHWLYEYIKAFGKPPSVSEMMKIGVYKAGLIYRMWRRDPEASLDWRPYAKLTLAETEEMAAVQNGSRSPEKIKAKIAKIRAQADAKIAALERSLEG